MSSRPGWAGIINSGATGPVPVSSCHRVALFVVLSLVLSTGLLSGCQKNTQQTDLNSLIINNRRFNVDDKRGLVRIFARLENPTATHFDEVEVYVTLLSPSGDKAGENSVLLQDLRPREKRDFALNVTSHASVRDVSLEVRPPAAP